jgi:hypothetical protein
MLRGSQIVLLLAVAGLAVGSYRAGAQAPKATELALKDGKARVEGALSKDDPKDVGGRKESPCKIYTVRFAANHTYHIDMMSKDFDSYLRLEGPDGKQVAEDDDGGDDLDARITYRCTTAGTYRIVATTPGPSPKLGKYTLVVRQEAGVAAKVALKGNELELKGGKARVEGALTRDDPLDVGGRRNGPCKIYTVRFAADVLYRIDLKSRDFDSFLRLEGPDGKQVAEDDDGGGGRDARIYYSSAKGGTYRIVATMFETPPRYGKYTLMVQEEGAAPKPIKLALKEGKARAEGKLSKDDPRDYRGGFLSNPCKIYAVDFESNRHYRIDMKSTHFNAHLRLEGPDGKTVARDDDETGKDRNAQIVLRSTTAGTYRIIATTHHFGSKDGKFGFKDDKDAKGGVKFGAFTIEVQQGAKLPELTLKDGKVRIESQLMRDDPRDHPNGGYGTTPSKAYTVRFEAEQTYRIDLTSRRFDSYLRLEGPDGQTVAENDDSDEGLDARIVFRCRAPGAYRIIVKTVANSWKFGDFALTVQERR